jgi:hypothetical protein
MKTRHFPAFTYGLLGGGLSKNGAGNLFAWRKYTLGCNQKSSKKATKLAITRFLLKFKVFKRFKKLTLSYIQANSFGVVLLPLPQMALQKTLPARGSIYPRKRRSAQGVRL